jgi:ubiquitin carboxyl-terminal hydrolase 5/13
MRKVADGLLSGRYSRPSTDALPYDDTGRTGASEVVFQKGLRPTGFKALVGKGHAEFATMKQQDSEEFLTHLIEVLRRDAKKVRISGTGFIMHLIDVCIDCISFPWGGIGNWV